MALRFGSRLLVRTLAFLLALTLGCRSSRETPPALPANAARAPVASATPGVSAGASAGPGARDAGSRELFLDGSIGDRPVALRLSRTGDAIHGSYMYVVFAREIALEGIALSDGTLSLTERFGSKTTGRFVLA